MRIFIAIIIVVFTRFSAHASEPISEMRGLAPFTGTWEQVMTDDAKSKPDVQVWEWAFGGKVVRIIHGNGSYGGESLIHWDSQQEKIIFRYITNAGFYTDGIMTPAEHGFDVHEHIRGAKSGPSEALSHYRITGGGNLHVKAKFKMNDVWGEPFTSTYKPAPDAVVKYDN